MQAEQHFARGNYAQVISDLGGGHALSPRDWALLGISHLRLGQLHEAEGPLQRAVAGGEAEALVEYGNLLRAEGRFADADRHFRDHEPAPGGELRARWLRWWGVTVFQAGRVEEGVCRVEDAVRAYLALGDETGAARTSVSLARMLVRVGQIQRAARLYRSVLPSLPAQPNPLPRLTALGGWLDLLLAGADEANRDEVMREALALLPLTPSEHARLPILACVAQLHARQGHWRQSAAVLEDMLKLTTGLQGYEASVWVYTRLAEHHARQGRYVEAHTLLQRCPQGERPGAQELFVKGLIAARQGIGAKARPMLEAALHRATQERRVLLAARAELQLASALHAEGHPETLSVLEHAVERLRHLDLSAAVQADLDDCAEVLYAGLLDPYLAPLIEPLRPKRGPLRSAAIAGTMRHLEIGTLGHLAVRLEGETLAVSPGTVALLTVMAQRPGLTRAALERLLYPDKYPSAATAAVKAHLAEVRRHLGPDALTRGGTYHDPTYSLAEHLAVTLDVNVLEEALHSSRLPLVLATYQGPFLPDHPSDWAQEQRDHLQARVGALVAREAAAARGRLAAGEAERLCTTYLTVQPDDLVVHAERVQAARALRDPLKLQTAEVAARHAGLDA